jgi:hypothetical protein
MKTTRIKVLGRSIDCQVVNGARKPGDYVETLAGGVTPYVSGLHMPTGQLSETYRPIVVSRRKKAKR